MAFIVAVGSVEDPRSYTEKKGGLYPLFKFPFVFIIGVSG